MNRPISRRTLLRGAGAAVALPFLEAMLPRRARAAAADPQRFVGFFVPNGIRMSAWTPATEGSGYALTPMLQPLAPVRDDVLVISGLANLNASVPLAGDHARGTGAFLTCRTPDKGIDENIQNGISLDQRLAQAIGDATRFRSIELGSDSGGTAGDCDSGYGCAYVRSIAWAGPKTPLPKEVNPSSVFDRLFGGVDQSLTLAQVARRRAQRKSVLDWVMDDTARLQARLGASDTAKLEEYLTAIRELEQGIAKEASQPQCFPGPKPLPPTDFQTQTRQLLELIALAFQCDLTRVATFMLGNGGSDRVHDFLGLSDGHHYLSHHQQDPGKLDALQAIGTWEVAQFAWLVERLGQLTEGDKRLIDNTLVYFSSEIEDGDTHAHYNLPVLVGGHGGGAVKPGRHLRHAAGQPMANLFVSVLGAMGVGDASFGADSTGPLAGVAG